MVIEGHYATAANWKNLYMFLFFSSRGVWFYLDNSESRHFSMSLCVLAVGVLSTVTRKFKCVIFLESNGGIILYLNVLF